MRRITVKLICAAFLAGAITGSTAYAFNAVLTDDTSLPITGRAVNLGASPTLRVDPKYMALLRFDLSLLPPGTTPDGVSVATLTVFINRVVKPGDVGLFTINGDWNERSVPAVTFTSLPGGPNATIPANAKNTFVCFDVTSLVKSWLGGAANTEVALGASSEGASLFLDSKESIAGGHCATLHIDLVGPQGPLSIGNGAISSTMLAPGAAAANLQSSGLSAVPSGGILLAPSPNATNLTALGYVRLGGPLDLSWQLRTPPSNPNTLPSGPAVWTGTEMFIWGGNTTAAGARYNPTSNTWLPVTTNGAAATRGGHPLIWTGTEIVVWGGSGPGARYNPASDTWTPITTNGAPTARSRHTALWTGSEMIIWGGANGANCPSDSARYNPASDTWAPVTTINAPQPRSTHTAVWTGREMIVWGGLNAAGAPMANGGRYDPLSNTWTVLPSGGAPEARSSHTAIWTGTEMIIWGGYGSGAYLNSGARYSPGSNSWTTLPSMGAPSPRIGHTAVWTGSNAIIWGGTLSAGINNSTSYNDGACYDPVADRWTPITPVGAPTARYGHSGVWTGTDMVIWGGASPLGPWCYTPSQVMYLYSKP